MSKTKFISLVLVSEFSSYVISRLPDSNRYDLYKDIKELQDQFEELDGDIENFTEDVKKLESEVSDSSEVTELTNYINRRASKKDDLVGSVDQEVDEAVHAKNDVKEKSLTLGLIYKSAKNDLKSLEKIHSELGDEDAKEIAENLISRLESQQTKSEQLLEKLDNKLAPILPENDNSYKRFPQDSSQVQQTEFNSFEPFGDD